MAFLQNRSNNTFSVPSVKTGWGFVVVLFDFLLTGIFWWQLPPQIPLFYSLPYGVNRLADRQWLFLLPGLALFIWLGYWLIARSVVRSSLYNQMFHWLHILCLILLTVAIIHILLIVL